MYLFEIPEKSKIKVECFDDGGEKIGDMVTFHHLDGMYSYCTVDGLPDDGKNILHLAANTPLKLVGKHYELYEE